MDADSICVNDFEGNIPSECCHLSELVHFSRGTNITANEMVDGPYPVVSAGLNYSGYHNDFNVKGPSITVSSSGANAGIVLFHNYDFWAADCNYADSSTDLNFAYYFLKYLQPVIFNMQCGAAQPHVYAKNLNRLKIKIPKKKEDRDKIARLLSNYDNLIENNKKRIQILEEELDLVFKNWFFKRETKALLSKKKIGDLNIEFESGYRPKGGIDLDLDSGIPSLGAENVVDINDFNFSSVNFVSENFFLNMKRGKNDLYNLLIYKDGAYIGKVAFFGNGFPFNEYCINEHVFYLKTEDLALKIYLFMYLKQKENFALMQNLNRNAAQPGLTSRDLKNMKIFIPSQEELNKYKDFSLPIFQNIMNLGLQNKNLANQRDLLLPRLMSGKLEVK